MYQFSLFSRTFLLIGAFLLLKIGCTETVRSQPFADGFEITTVADGAQDVYTVDIDGDGDLDVLSASSRDDKIAWYRNGDSSGGGDGSSWTTTVITTSAYDAQSVYAKDIDGDGDQDVLFASKFDDKIAWYRNGDSSGGGDGSSWTEMIITGSALDARSVYATDIDGDGDQDVLSASNEDDKIAWYRNGDSNGGGDGSSWTTTVITTSADAAISVFAADIDGDGDQDVLSTSVFDDKVAWYRNGDSSGGGDGSSWTTTVITTSADAPQNVYAADIDGDGDQDVLSASFSDNKIAWYKNEDSNGGGDGTSWTGTEITTSAGEAVSVHAADADGDGDPDVFSASNSDDKIEWYENARITEVVYVDPDAGGAADGTSWTDAYPTLQDALANLSSGTVELWVASGTYMPDEGGGQTQGDRSTSFAVPSGVKLYGGFDGTDGAGSGTQESDRSQRNPDPATNNTVLTGDLGTEDFPNDNAYHVVTIESNAGVVLDGFTVRDGTASTSSPDNSGAGIWAKNGSTLRLHNARLLDNTASGSGGDGGGLFGEGAVTMEDVTLSNNSAIDIGGGVYIIGGRNAFTNVTADSNEGAGIRVTGTDNTFDNVTARDNVGLGIGAGGGSTFTNVEANRNESSGISTTGSNNVFTDVTASNNAGRGIQGGGTFTNVTVENDTSSGSGGGISLTGNSTLSQVTLSGNKAQNSGGGLYSNGYDVDLASATFVGNDASESGGGLYVQDATLRMVNSSFYGNEQTGTSFDGGGLYLENTGGTLGNVVLSGNSAAGNGGGLYIAPSGNVPVVNVTAANNTAGGEGGALYTTSTNSNDFPSLRNSIVWGNTSASSGNAQQVFIESGDLPVEHSIIEDGVPDGAFDGGDNLDQDPQFADSTGADGKVGTADDDLRLQGPGSSGGPSPAIEAGDSGLLPSDVLDINNNSDTSEPLPLDRAGNARERDVGEVSGTGVDMGAYESTGDPLPVELVTFNVTQQSEATVLMWKTASEQNNAGFEVQRRVSNEWTTLSFIEGAGTTSEAQTYRHRDTNLPYEADSVTYRLKQVDIDGTTTFSEARTLNVGAPEELSLHAPFPNPARGQVTLRYALPSKIDVSIRVYDVLGRRVATLQRGVEDAGRKEIQISTADLSSGTYFVRMQAGEKLKTKRLTVVK